eukprot:gene342-6756_t
MFGECKIQLYSFNFSKDKLSSFGDLMIVEAISNVGENNFDSALLLLKEKDKNFSNFDTNFLRDRYEHILSEYQNKDNLVSSLREAEISRSKFLLSQLKYIEQRIPEEKSDEEFMKNLKEYMSSFPLPFVEESLNVEKMDIIEEVNKVSETIMKIKQEKKKDSLKVKTTPSPKTSKKLTTTSLPKIKTPSPKTNKNIKNISVLDKEEEERDDIFSPSKQKVKTKSTPIVKTRDRDYDVSKNSLTELVINNDEAMELKVTPTKKRKRDVSSGGNNNDEKKSKKNKSPEQLSSPVTPQTSTPIKVERRGRKKKEVKLKEEEEKRKNERIKNESIKSDDLMMIEEIQVPIKKEKTPTKIPNVSSSPTTPSSTTPKIERRGRKKKIETILNQKKEIQKMTQEQKEKVHILLDETILKLYENNDLVEIFQYPVSNDVAEFYDKIIKLPIDLTEIKKLVDERKMNSILQLKQKLLLMFSNALIYNPPTHDVHKITIKIKDEVNLILQDFYEKELNILKK